MKVGKVNMENPVNPGLEPETKAVRLIESGSREAVVLENGMFRVMIDLEGGMVAELSRKSGQAFINAHWLPWFRQVSAVENPTEGTSPAMFQKIPLLTRIAGNFPCVPSFGGGNPVNGVVMPPHGWAANEKWDLAGLGTVCKGTRAWARFKLKSPEQGMKLEFDKLDMIFAGESVHYTILGVKNAGDKDLEINAAWHNTIGPPFLERGCRISASAGRWMGAPETSEFGGTGELAMEEEFRKIERVPLRAGGFADASRVPGMIGFTDFLTGAVPDVARLGWSACVNDKTSLAYVTWFPGPASVKNNEMGLNFNNFWLQYGGRPFTPWAMYEGGTDQTFCLGMENSTGAWANGLADSIARKELLGRPTTITIKAGEKKTLPYATGLFDLPVSIVDEPVLRLESRDAELMLMFERSAVGVKADGEFNRLRKIARNDDPSAE